VVKKGDEVHSVHPLYYPIMLQLHGKRCVVVGGGKIGWRRAKGLLEAGADVTVISPIAVPELAEAAKEGKLAWERRAYCPGESVFDGAVLVFAATDDAAVNEAAAQEASHAGALVCAADDADRGGFLVPAVIRRGALTISVATGGASPSLARRIASELSASYGEEYAAYTELLARTRRRIKQEVPDAGLRRAMLEALLEMDLLPRLRHGEPPEQVERSAWSALVSVRGNGLC
jgi:precorrin-2 dehydrogenase / sirohydrochlorin ferrochelatase